MTDSVLLVSCDNQLFPFSSDALINTPLRIFIKFAIGYTLSYGVHIIQISLYSIVIQNFVHNITGIYLASIPHSSIPLTSQNNENPLIEKESSDIAESTTESNMLDNYLDFNIYESEFTGENVIITDVFPEADNFLELDIFTDESLGNKMIDDDVFYF